MDENDIEIFRTLIKEKNVTRASEKLFVTQSSVTKRIQRMENELGCTLFIRTKKGIIPTPVAEKILSDLCNVQDILKKVKNYTLSSEGVIAGTLDIGVSINYARYSLPKILKTYMTNYPDVDIKVLTGHSTNLYSKLSNNEINIAIIRGDFYWEEGSILLSEEPVCFVASEDPQNTPINSLPNISRNTDPSFENSLRIWREENNIGRSHSTLYINDISTCLEMVKNGIGWALLPEICLKNFDGYIKPLYLKDGTALTRKTYVLYKNDYYDLPQVKLFIDSLL